MHRGERLSAWARELDRPEKVAPAPQPAPKPPRAARPKRLSVTDIEHWLRDPYTIYAKYILRLTPLDAVDIAPGAAERGTIIHAAIGDFTQRFAKGLPSDPVRELIELGRAAFCRAGGFSGGARVLVAAFRAHRAAGSPLGGAAAPGNRARSPPKSAARSTFRLPEGAFKLRGIADRIERRADGRYVILDYKTGSARTEKQVRTGLAPQLTLEAAMLRKGGFPEIAAGASVAQIGYVLLKGGAPARRTQARSSSRKAPPTARPITRWNKLTELARRFDDDNEPYRSLVHPMWTTHYGDYDHLARVKEWSATGGEIDDIWGGE